MLVIYRLQRIACCDLPDGGTRALTQTWDSSRKLWNNELVSRFLNEGEKQMTKTALLKKLEGAIDDAIRQRLYGNIEIEFRAGEPVILRSAKTEKLDDGENNRHGQAYR